jgi:hypothetical protein
MEQALPHCAIAKVTSCLQRATCSDGLYAGSRRYDELSPASRPYPELQKALEYLLD